MPKYAAEYALASICKEYVEITVTAPSGQGGQRTFA